MAHAVFLGWPITVDEAGEVLDCLQQIRVLAEKGVIVDDGRWCGVLSAFLIPTRGQRIVTELESLRERGGTHVMVGEGHVGSLLTIEQAIRVYGDLDDNAFGLGQIELGRAGLFECDIDGRRMWRGQTIDGAVTKSAFGVIIRDDGYEWHGIWIGMDGLPDKAGAYRRQEIVATAVQLSSLDRKILDRAQGLAGSVMGASGVEQAFRINDEAYLFTFRGGL
ncbi:MAG: hypothetical protein HGB02_09895 [Chlorobiaceae bacterium]|nr:hypothetical protein [Chlorobiaceae bacterium]